MVRVSVFIGVTGHLEVPPSGAEEVDRPDLTREVAVIVEGGLAALAAEVVGKRVIFCAVGSPTAHLAISPKRSWMNRKRRRIARRCSRVNFCKVCRNCISRNCKNMTSIFRTRVYSSYSSPHFKCLYNGTTSHSTSYYSTGLSTSIGS